MKIGKLFSLAAALLFAVACDKSEEFEPVFSFTSNSVQSGIVTVPSEGASLSFVAESNITWRATSDQSWVVVTPAQFMPTTDDVVTTNVSVNVLANEAYEPRTATLTVEAGSTTTVIRITQEAAEVPLYLEVKDDEGNVPTEIEVVGAGDEVILSVFANTTWMSSTENEWISLEEGASTLKITVAKNEETTPREGEVEISGAGVESVKVAIKQAAGEAKVLTVDVDLKLVSEYAGQVMDNYPDHSCLISIMENPSAKIVSGYYGLWQSAAWDDSELKDVETVRDILVQYGNPMESAEIDGLNKVSGADPCEWLWSKLYASTEYIFVAYFVDEAGRECYGYKKTTTASAPTGTAEYNAWSGNYTFSVKGQTYNAVISAKTINQSLNIDLSDGKEYIEDFVCEGTWDSATNTVTISAQELGTWTHPQYGEVKDCVYALCDYMGSNVTITGNGYPIAKLSKETNGNITVASAGTVNVNGVGKLDIVAFSLFGVTSAGNLRYVDPEEFLFFPFTLTVPSPNAATNAKKDVAPLCEKNVFRAANKEVSGRVKSLNL